MGWRFESLLVGLTCGVLTGSAHASILYGLEYDNRQLLVLSQANGSSSVLGSTAPGASLRDLASDTRAASFRIWANSYDGGQLWRVNPSTGATTLVGAFNLPAGQFMRALAFVEVTSQLYGTTDLAANLYRIDPTTGAATAVGAVGVQNVNGLGVDAGGTLYAVTSASGTIYRLDKSTGVGTALADTKLANLGDVAFRPDDGTMFVNSYNQVFTVDPATGAATPVGAAQNYTVTGIAFGPVPEPGGALLATALTIFGIAPRGRRRR